jgi:ABC-type multidrug transport system ATPase subunit
MEEADTLCSQIGIMANGALRCLGNQVYLKREYGSGYRITLTAPPQRIEKACRFVESILPQGWKRIDRYATTALYEFRGSDVRLSEIFAKMQQSKDALGIDDWGLSQTR